MSIQTIMDGILLQCRHISREAVERYGLQMRTATVAQVSPVLIRYDGEDDPSVVPPRRAVVVAVGDRVVVVKSRGQATIIGVLGGQVGPWHPVTVLPGFSAQSGFTPRVRMEYGRVRLEGGINGANIEAGSNQNVMQVPEAFRSSEWGYGLVVSSNADATGMAVVQSDGRVSLRTSERTGSYYLWSDFFYDL